MSIMPQSGEIRKCPPGPLLSGQYEFVVRIAGVNELPHNRIWSDPVDAIILRVLDEVEVSSGPGHFSTFGHLVITSVQMIACTCWGV